MSGNSKGQFIVPIVESVQKVLSTMASITPKAQKPIVLTEPGEITGVTAIVGLVGNKVQGSMAILFETGVYLKIVSNMLGEEFKEITPEITDAAAEIANMVFGQMKVKLSEIGYNLEMAIPTVINGKDYKLSYKSEKPIFKIPFTTDFGNLSVEVIVDIEE